METDVKKHFLAFVALLLIMQACAPRSPISTETAVTESVVSTTEVPLTDTASRLKRLGGTPCPDSIFTCITLTVPLDHFNSDDRTMDVVFAILRATGERKGMFVTATGGPGTAGLQSADDYTAAFDPSIPEHFDIVFFDQRGTGLSGGLQCVDSVATYYQTNADASTPAGETTIVEATKVFAEDCVREMGHADWLPYLGTDQAIEDLETFRAMLGDGKFWLYGESYGTQYAQTYAAAHPEHLAALLLDGTVDLTFSGADFLAQQARAFNDVFLQTLQACNADEFCAADMGVDAVIVYNGLAKQLKKAPIPFDFPLASGGVAHRQFSFSDLENSASSYLYSETARMIFLRALAAYARNGDLIPMARVLYDSLSLDPETLAAIPDPSYSDGVYYSVECRDYNYFSGTPDERAEAYMRAGDGIDTLPYFSSVFYGDLPCVFWPNAQENPARPAPLPANGIPTIVLGGTADPATPNSNGVNVYKRLSDAYLVTETGGPHIIFGWGVTCVDELVTAFLVEGQVPAQRETTCEGVVASDFVSLAPINAADFTTPLDALRSADDEIFYLPEYYYWDGITPTSTSCPFGGTLSYQPSDTGYALTLKDCAFSRGFIMTGDGSYNTDDGLLTLNVNVTGLANGTLVYTHNADNELHVTGEYRGQKVDLTN
jgi:pimeloyl-ACP methyl ester carboxylesterase